MRRMPQRDAPGGRFSITSMMKRHDRDEDGKVTREEWQGPAELFGLMDRNGDGAITKEEFEARMQERGGFGGGQGRPGESRSQPEAAQKFDVATLLRRFDANRNGKVSKEELDKFFKWADSNDDGSLSEDEIGVALTTKPDDDNVEVEGPSVAEGQKAGIGVGWYAPDFELQPIEAYACLQEWLGADDPVSVEECVPLSRLIGEQPVLLLFGSYT